LRIANISHIYRQQYEDKIKEGSGTIQKISTEFLIKAITDIRARKMKLETSELVENQIRLINMLKEKRTEWVVEE
jgi:hypothetical protein